MNGLKTKTKVFFLHFAIEITNISSGGGSSGGWHPFYLARRLDRLFVYLHTRFCFFWTCANLVMRLIRNASIAA